MPSPVSPGRRFGGFQGLGGVFPDAPSIRLFPQVIESGLVCPLLQPVVHHVVDCRADLDAKSRPAGRKTRRSKGSVESPDNRVSARCTKCFRFDIRLPPGAACRLRPGRAVQGLEKIFSGFSRIHVARPPTCLRHTARPAKNPECFKRETSFAPVRFSQTRKTAFQPHRGRIAISRFGPRFASHDFFSNNAFTGQRHRARFDPDKRQHKKVAADQAAFTANGASCTQPIVEYAIAPNAVLNG